MKYEAILEDIEGNGTQIRAKVLLSVGQECLLHPGKITIEQGD